MTIPETKKSSVREEALLVGGPTAIREKPTPAARRALFSGAAGSSLEWFDFSLYGVLSATVFPTLFFSEADPVVGLLASFATFGVGMAARPAGALFFGQLGDRIGRRQVLLATFLLMGITSIVIGVLPPHSSIGFMAPLILVMMRFCQGFALGGEATGAQLMTMEHAPKDRRAFYSAIMSMGSPISQVVVNLMLTLLAVTLSTEDFHAWGWRLPFILSIALVIVGIYIRLKVEETPIFKENVEAIQEEGTNPLFQIRSHWKTVVSRMMVHAPITLTFYLISVYGISYLTGRGFEPSETYTMVLVSNFVSIFVMYVGGRLADRIGRRWVLFVGAATGLVGVLMFFPAANSGSFMLALIAVAIALCGTQFGNAAPGAFFAESFPTRIRYTGSALSLTGANLIFGAPTPFLAAWFGTFGLGPLPLIIYYTVLVLFAMFTIYVLREGKTLEGEPQTFGSGRLRR